MITCEYFEKQMDDLFDGCLPSDESQKLKQHLAHCEHCKRLSESHLNYLNKIRNLNTPSPEPGAMMHLLRQTRLQAEEQHTKVRQRRSFLMGFIAASLLMTITFFSYQTYQSNTDLQLAAIDDFLNEEEQPLLKEITVTIHVPSTLESAQLALQLPDNLRIQGFESMQHIAWPTHLEKGVNQLTLPLLVQPGTDLNQPHIIAASIQYQQQQKGFQLSVDLNTPQKSSVDA